MKQLNLAPTQQSTAEKYGLGVRLWFSAYSTFAVYAISTFKALRLIFTVWY